MAKKTSKPAKSAVANKKVAEAKPAIAPAKSNVPAISDDLIGEAAGQIWNALSGNSGLTITALKKSVDAPSDVVLAGLGWLAREGKVSFATAGRTLKVSLR